MDVATTEAADRPTYALIDIDPGDRDELRGGARAGAAVSGPRSSTCGVIGLPKVTGKRGVQIWLPIKPIYTLRADARLGRVALARGRPDGAGAGQLGMVEARPRGRARLDFTQNAINRTLVGALLGAARAGGAGLGADHLGRARRSDRLPRTAGRFARLPARLAKRSATCSRRRWTLDQELPPLVGGHGAAGWSPFLGVTGMGAARGDLRTVDGVTGPMATASRPRCVRCAYASPSARPSRLERLAAKKLVSGGRATITHRYLTPPAAAVLRGG